MVRWLWNFSAGEKKKGRKTSEKWVWIFWKKKN